MKNKDYSRRRFIQMNSSAGLGILMGGTMLNQAVRIGDSENNRFRSGVGKIQRIAGLSLEELRGKYQYELFENFLPNMDRYAIDHEFGGVMCSLDVRSGELINTNKTAWFVGRGMWVYSFLYNNFKRDSRYLEIAKKSKDLLLKLQPSDDSFWTRSFDREGRPLSGPGDIYGSLFVAEGLFEYATATGEREYRQLAKKIIFDCVERYDRMDYEFVISYLPNAPEIKAPRVLGHWMIFLSLCTQMLKHEPDAELEALASRSVKAIMEHHINPAHGLTNEVINHDLTIPDNEYAQFCVIGHGLETLTFVMFEAARLKDKELFQSAREAFKRHVDVATDALYGGYFHSLHEIDNYKWDTRKSLWCQQEVLNGALFLIEHTADDWGFRHFARADDFVYSKFYDKNNKFWYSGGDRKVDRPNSTLMEHYHHARQLMLGILSIDRMIERKGAISGLFS